MPHLPGNAPQEIGFTCPTSGATSPFSPTTNWLVSNPPPNSAGDQVSFGGNTVAYDGENRVISVKTSAGSLEDSSQYDGDGRRIVKTTPLGTTTYVYDALGGLAAEYVGGVWSKDYIRLRSQFVSSGQELVATENAAGNGSPCATCFLMLDGLGNVRVVADGNGNIYARHDYLPFGEETSSTDPNRPAASGFGLVDDVTQRFTGKERDSESGLDYFGARYYGSNMGRFMSPDWNSNPDEIPYADIRNPQSLNLYQLRQEQSSSAGRSRRTLLRRGGGSYRNWSRDRSRDRDVFRAWWRHSCWGCHRRSSWSRSRNLCGLQNHSLPDVAKHEHDGQRRQPEPP